tara:strand:+ start:1468 stop:1767 length:300 start_codon:yes stop_codon:yes gene_type:complete
MNKKQWYTFGIGLVLMSFFFSIMGGLNDCSNLANTRYESIEEYIDAGLDIEFIQNAMLNSELLIISCFEDNDRTYSTSTISFTIGILFVIMGSLEPKRN